MSEAAAERKGRRIATPEELHDYIHVTGPNLWILLAVIVALLAGLIILSSTIVLENTMSVQAEVAGAGEDDESGELICVLTDERKNQPKVGMEVRVAGVRGTVQAIYEDDEGVIVMISLDREDTKLREGTYDAEIVLETTTAISFLLST